MAGESGKRERQGIRNFGVRVERGGKCRDWIAEYHIQHFNGSVRQQRDPRRHFISNRAWGKGIKLGALLRDPKKDLQKKQ